MPKSKIILVLGFLIALLPVTGFPQSWKSFLEVASGLMIVLLSVLISVDRRLTLKAKAEKRVMRKRALAQASVPETPVAEAPTPTGPLYGRRATDRRLPVRDADQEEAASETPNTPEL